MSDTQTKRKKFAVIAVIEAALIVQVIATVVADPTRTRIMASLVELVIITAALAVSWWVILHRK
ncbi:hypothetical protein Afe05nite_50500 [Paractinoplanes ferrugineus]|uniref:Uncharacterized protein n=1 Tax=Paractinoplanes ferrugineus TaxID=113564 RepID=A0A919J2A6_9ACTN|nr:hypothetical protein Afe05nite_50500 [Actinoplanes ferrugineus]